jgi:hypothetical protein
MSNRITYYAIVGGDATADRPLGLVRRLEHDDGPEDERMRRDLSWKRTPIIVEWEHESYEHELVQVSHEQASKIGEYLREKFAREPNPGG